MSAPELRVVVTGHRPAKLGGESGPAATWVRARLDAALEDVEAQARVAGQRLVACSGMALGTDLWFANACRRRGVPLVAAVPFFNHDALWPPMARVTLREVLAATAHIEVVHREGAVDAAHAAAMLTARNAWMLRWGAQAALAGGRFQIIAVWNGDRWGGTADFLRGARAYGVGGIRIEPRTQTVLPLREVA